MHRRRLTVKEIGDGIQRLNRASEYAHRSLADQAEEPMWLFLRAAGATTKMCVRSNRKRVRFEAENSDAAHPKDLGAASCPILN